MEIKLGSPGPYSCLAIEVPGAGMHVPRKNRGKATGVERTHKLE